MLDVLIYNINFISIGLMVGLMLLIMPSYAGGNVSLSLVLCTLLVLPTAAVYALLSAAMPRSGGDYVYVSRVLGPALGMMSSWNMTVWWVLYGGVPSAFLATYGIAPLFRVLAAMTQNVGLAATADWVVTPMGQFIIGSLLILLLTTLFTIGLRTYFRVQNVLFAIAMLSTLVALAVGLTADVGAFPAIFNQYVGVLSGKPDTYQQIVSASGYAPADFSWSNTILPMTWIYLTLGFSFSSAYIGGEVKQAARLQIWSIPGTVLYAAVFGLLLIFAATRAVGADFLGAISTLSDLNAANVGLSAMPRFHELLAYSSQNVVVAVLICVGFIFWSYAWLPGQILNASRNLLAYAVDGLMPAQLATVSERYHTPVVSLWVMGLLSIVSLGLYVFTPYFATLSGIFGFILTFILVSVAAILLPYRRPEVFEGSPVKWRVGGIPVMSIVGTLSLLGCVAMAWVFLNDPYSGISLDPSTLSSGILGFGMLLINLGIFLSGLIIYFVAQAVRRRAGLEIALNYKEIPAE
jgi:amino acid transporter